MIASLTGIVNELSPPEIILAVGGIEYEILAPLGLFYGINKGDKIKIFTHLNIKQDSHTLFGFLTTQEKKMFQDLIKISGIGPKVGITILSHLNSDELIKCIELENDNVIAKTPGIGKKTAQKIIIELKPRINKLNFNANTSNNPKVQEALTTLGFKKREITAMLEGVDNSLSTAEIIKYALKNK